MSDITTDELNRRLNILLRMVQAMTPNGATREEILAVDPDKDTVVDIFMTLHREHDVKFDLRNGKWFYTVT